MTVRHHVKKKWTEINGVRGRMVLDDNDRHTAWKGTLFRQHWTSDPRPLPGIEGGELYVHIRYDDRLQTGHHKFIIGGYVKAEGVEGARYGFYEEIKTVFPELAPLLRWHKMTNAGEKKALEAHGRAHEPDPASPAGKRLAEFREVIGGIGFQWESEHLDLEHEPAAPRM